MVSKGRVGVPQPEPKDFRKHLYALDVSGFTRIPMQLLPHQVEELRTVSNRALSAVRKAISRGIRVPFQPGSDHYAAANALYCWGPAALALLEHRTARRIADLMLGEYLLNDLTVFCALPAPTGSHVGTTSWHRDSHSFDEVGCSGHLWMLFYLDDFTPDNGATWIVPGSHRSPSSWDPPPELPWKSLDLERFPSRVQLLGRAGDLVIIDARAIHSSDINRTSGQRRMINLGLVKERYRMRIRRNHWYVAGPEIQIGLNDQLAKILGRDLEGGAGEPPSVLPEGWRCGRSDQT